MLGWLCDLNDDNNNNHFLNFYYFQKHEVGMDDKNGCVFRSCLLWFIQGDSGLS